jgi:predicted molibdopterin-dependent oxidoreductase YjgC
VARRLALGPAISRGPAVSVLLDGRPVSAHAGETVAAVMLAEGHLATRTTPGGTPRGLFCGMGVCFDCLVVVDGIPNTRACMTYVADGMDVRRQAGLLPLDAEGAGR